jgi:hypothetical protein
LLAGADPETAFGPSGLLDDLKKAFAERALYAEMDSAGLITDTYYPVSSGALKRVFGEKYIPHKLYPPKIYIQYIYFLIFILEQRSVFYKYSHSYSWLQSYVCYRLP